MPPADVLPIDPHNPNPRTLAIAADVIRRGGLVALGQHPAGVVEAVVAGGDLLEVEPAPRMATAPMRNKMR